MFRNYSDDMSSFFLEGSNIMNLEINHEIVSKILKDFLVFLEDGVVDTPERFPYLMACVHFMEELEKKGVEVSFDTFDSEIVDAVAKEIGEYLSH